MLLAALIAALIASVHAAPQVDLQVTFRLSGGTDLYVGEAVGGRFSVQVTNAGPDALPATTEWFPVGFYLSFDDVITTSDYLLLGGREGWQATNGLAVGESVTISIYNGMSIATETYCGTAYIGALLETVPTFESTPPNYAAIQVRVRCPGDVDPEPSTTAEAEPYDLRLSVRLKGEQEISIDEPLGERLLVLFSNNGRSLKGTIKTDISVFIGDSDEPTEKDVLLASGLTPLALPDGLRTGQSVQVELAKDLRLVSRLFCGWRYLIVRVYKAIYTPFGEILIPIWRVIRVWIRCRDCSASDCTSCLHKRGCGWCSSQQSTSQGICFDLSRPFACTFTGLFTEHCPSTTAPCCPLNPDKANWNDADTQGSNNCYNYASNIETDTFAQPGRASGNPIPNCCTCANTIAAANSDGVVGPVADQNSCPAGYCSVYLVVSDSTSGTIRDYHWYRLNQDGTWSHKPGGTAARCTDASNNLIADPSTANHHYGINYNRKCGFMCVPCNDPNFHINLLDLGLGATVPGLLGGDEDSRERTSIAVRGLLSDSGVQATFAPGFASSLEPVDHNPVPAKLASQIAHMIGKLSRPVTMPGDSWKEYDVWAFNFPCSGEDCGSYLIGKDGLFLNRRTGLMYEFAVDRLLPWQWLYDLGFKPPRSHRNCPDHADCKSCQEHSQCHWTGGKCTPCILECIQAVCPARCEDLVSCSSCNAQKRCSWGGDAGCKPCSDKLCLKPRCPREDVYAAQFNFELSVPQSVMLLAVTAATSKNNCPDVDQAQLFGDIRAALDSQVSLSVVECEKIPGAADTRVKFLLEIDDEDATTAKGFVEELGRQAALPASRLRSGAIGKFARVAEFIILRPILLRRCALGVTWQGNSYRVNLGTGATQFMAASGFPGLNALTVGGGVFYSASGSTLVSINPTSGIATSLGTFVTASGLTARALSYRTTNSLIYAVMSPSSTTTVDQLWTINPATLATNKIGDLVGYSGIQASMFRSTTLYAWSIFHGLVTININTAAVTLVGVGSPGSVGAAQWMTSNVLQNFVGRSSIYGLSVATGVGSFVANTDNSGDFRGMAISNSVSCPAPSCTGSTCGTCTATAGCGWCNGPVSGSCFPTSMPFSCTVGSLFTTPASCPPPVATRRNIDDLTASQLRRLRRAWKKVAASGDYEAIATVHGNAGGFRWCHHNIESFPEWHRPYVRAFEQLLQAADAAIQAGPDAQAGLIDYSQPLGLPFWAWSDTPGVAMTAPGIQSAWCRSNGAGGCNLLPPALSAPMAFVDSNVVQEANPLYRFQTSGGSWTTRFGVFPTIAGFESSLLDVGDEPTHALTWDLQETPHDAIHCDVGGTMCSANSALDPAFWFHHNNVDRILQGWYQIGANQANSITEMAGSPGSISIPIPGPTPNQIYTRLAAKLPPYLDGGGATDPWNAAADYYTVQDVLSRTTQAFGYVFASVPQWPPPLLEERNADLLQADDPPDYLYFPMLPAKTSATLLVFIDLNTAELEQILRASLFEVYSGGNFIGKAHVFSANGQHLMRNKHISLRGYLSAKQLRFDEIRSRIQVLVWPHDPRGLVSDEYAEPPLPLTARLVEDYYKENGATYPGHAALNLAQLRKLRQGGARVAGLHIKEPTGAVTIGTDGAMRFGSSNDNTFQYQNDVEIRGVNILESIRKVEEMVDRLQKQFDSKV